MQTPTPESNLPGAAPHVPAGWTPLPVEHLPAPTFWPAGLALGLTLLFWGLISSWVVLAVGAAFFVRSFVGWIRDIRHEHRELLT